MSTTNRQTEADAMRVADRVATNASRFLAGLVRAGAHPAAAEELVSRATALAMTIDAEAKLRCLERSTPTGDGGAA